MKKPIVIYGAGIFGKQLFFDSKRYGAMEIVGFTMDEQYIGMEKLYGLPLVSFEKVNDFYPPDQYEMIVACGYTVMSNRVKMYQKAKDKGYHLANYISPKAILEGEQITMGDNNIILTNAFVGFDCVLGNNNVIRQNVYLGHESTLHDHIVISAGCQLGGRSIIEDMVFLGIGTTGRDAIIYGRESLIGVGSNMVKNAKQGTIYFGNPAVEMGKRDSNTPIN